MIGRKYLRKFIKSKQLRGQMKNLHQGKITTMVSGLNVVVVTKMQEITRILKTHQHQSWHLRNEIKQQLPGLIQMLKKTWTNNIDQY